MASIPTLSQLQQQMADLQQLMNSMRAAQSSGTSALPLPGNASSTTISENTMLQHNPGSANPQYTQPSTSSGPITPYQSARAAYPALSAAPQGHPSTSSMHADTASRRSTQPFLGLDNLAVDYSRQVNQARLASSAATQPRTAPLATRRPRRTRGPASAPPRLPSASRPDVRSCVTEVFPSDGGPARVHLMLSVKVFPGHPTSENQQYILYRFIRDSVNGFLAEHHLLYHYTLDPSTRVLDLIARVITDMTASPARYIFDAPPSRSSAFQSHEVQPLQLLGLVNRGMLRASDNQAHLRPDPVNRTMTLQDLAGSTKFANALECIEDGRFCLYLVTRPNQSFSALTTFSHITGRHLCISERFHTQFDSDPQGGLGQSPLLSCTDGCPDDGTPEPIVPSPAISHETSRPPVMGMGASSYLPVDLWSRPWQPPSSTGSTYSINNLSSDVFSAAGRGQQNIALMICGSDITVLATQLQEKLAAAATSGNFSEVLSPDRSFLIERDDTLISSGIGIERETVHAAYGVFLDSSLEWFTSREDGFFTPAAAYSMAVAGDIPTERLMKLTQLGALSALLLIHGIAPGHLDPVFLQYLVYDCNLEAVHPSFLGEWHPGIRQQLMQWIAAGPDGNIDQFQGHFATYHDISIALLRSRTPASHMATAADMLYRSTIGSQPPSHPEIQAFKKGFMLPCSNGFNFAKVVRNFAGGSETFFSLMYTSQIESFESLQPFVQIHPLPRASPAGIDFAAALTSFLQGSGIPCPSLFDDVKSGISSVIDLAKIDDPGFRSRIFCWAVHGTPFLPTNGAQLEVYFVHDDDVQYAPARYRAGMMAEGKICFRTCFSQARIPMSYIQRLMGASHSPDREPHSAHDAIEHWLLYELLSAIGSHTIA